MDRRFVLKTTQTRRLVQSCSLNLGKVKPGHPGSGSLGWKGYLAGKRWAVPRRGTPAPGGTGCRWVPVRSGPPSRKLPRAHNRNPTFPGAAASAAPSPAGVPRTQRAPRAAGRARRSTSRRTVQTRAETGVGLEVDGGWFLSRDEQSRGGGNKKNNNNNNHCLEKSSAGKKCPDGKSTAFQVLPAADTLVLGMVPCEPADASSGLLLGSWFRGVPPR